MTNTIVTEKAVTGNPHAWFDEGEVAPAATPRRGSLLYNGTSALVYENADPNLPYAFPSCKIHLKPGQIYRFSAWIRTEGLKSVSVRLRNQSEKSFAKLQIENAIIIAKKPQQIAKEQRN